MNKFLVIVPQSKWGICRDYLLMNNIFLNDPYGYSCSMDRSNVHCYFDHLEHVELFCSQFNLRYSVV